MCTLPDSQRASTFLGAVVPLESCAALCLVSNWYCSAQKSICISPQSLLRRLNGIQTKVVKVELIGPVHYNIPPNMPGHALKLSKQSSATSITLDRTGCFQNPSAAKYKFIRRMSTLPIVALSSDDASWKLHMALLRSLLEITCTTLESIGETSAIKQKQK